MPGPLRVVAGLGIVVCVAAYYAIGMLFILAAPSPTGYHLSFGIAGMLAICGPPILLGVHLAFFGPGRGPGARRALVWALAATQVAGVAGMSPQLLHAATRGDAVEVMVSGLLSACLFGWPLVGAIRRAPRA